MFRRKNTVHVEGNPARLPINKDLVKFFTNSVNADVCTASVLHLSHVPFHLRAAAAEFQAVCLQAAVVLLTGDQRIRGEGRVPCSRTLGVISHSSF